MSRSMIPLLLLAATACRFPYAHDPEPIASRYAHRMEGPCSAWVQSYLTGFKYCSSPKIDLPVQGAQRPAPADPATLLAALTKPAPAPAPASGTGAEGPTDVESLRTHGEEVYKTTCAVCHGATGAGVPGAFPPLAGSGSFYGDPQNHAKIIVHGLSGQITVQGVNYNSAMPPQGHLSDYDIAAVATFERTSWGNDDGAVMPADVAAVR